MPRGKAKSNQRTTQGSFPLKRETTALALLAAGIFYYLCILSYDPLDPSLFAFASHDVIRNLGGVLGAYLAGFLFFLFGGASYFFGIYFLVNAVLVFTKKRTQLKFLDFFVFLLCTAFMAIFLQLQFVEISFGAHNINAGGGVGKLLGDLGRRYLGAWGVYLVVLFGVLLTFTVATRLSLVAVLNNSTAVLGRGMGSFAGLTWIYLARLKKFLARKWGEYKVRREKDRQEKAAAPRRPVCDTATESISAGPPVNPVKKAVERMLDPKQGPVVLARKDKGPRKISHQMELENLSEGYQLPPVAFLNYEESEQASVDEESLKMSARILESKLKDFAIDGHVTEIHPGPVITMYEFQPAPGVKLSRINSLTDDLSLAMGGRSVRVVTPLPNKSAIGIEIPNHVRETVWFKDVVTGERFQRSESRLVFALGKDIEGVPYCADLQKMPHLLVAGSTGSGKSVSINTMICSILYKARPDEVRLILIDPKMIELSIYEGIPHLLLPVVTDPKKANLALKWAVREMERRYKLLADVNARHIAGYNKKMAAGEIKNKEPDLGAMEEPVVHDGKLPQIVIVIDEFADLMMVSSKEVEESVCRLAQKARAAGIHVILATQRPSVDVITGIIKANFPARIAFRVTSKHDSRTILDCNGAERLLGMGDMLFAPPGSSKLIRLHGAFISEEEITRIGEFLKKQAKPRYNEEILKNVPEGNGLEADDEDLDEFYEQAVRQVCETRRVSISSIQRQFRIGYNRAARIVEQMEHRGVVSSPNGQGQRDVLAPGI